MIQFRSTSKVRLQKHMSKKPLLEKKITLVCW